MASGFTSDPWPAIAGPLFQHSNHRGVEKMRIRIKWRIYRIFRKLSENAVSKTIIMIITTVIVIISIIGG